MDLDERGVKNSTIDYVMVGDELEKNIIGMKIDDMKARWTIGSDHSWIETSVTLGAEKTK